jgi:hypothetical protein
MIEDRSRASIIRNFGWGAGNPTPLEWTINSGSYTMKEFSRTFLKINDKFKRATR